MKRALSTSTRANSSAEQYTRVVPAHARSEREAAHVAERFATGEPGRSGQLPVWSFRDIPLHSPESADRQPEMAVELRNDGELLDRDIADRLAPLLGSAVTEVRVHRDASAADTASRAGAAAVTVGRDVAFAAGRYDPHSRAGQRLITHELAHVAQQARHPGRPVAQRQGGGQVAAPTTLAGLPEAQRKRLQVISTLPLEAVSSGQLKGAFQAATIGSSAGEVVADGSVPKGVARGLINLAGDWSTGKKPDLKPNQTVTVELDLTPYGGAKGLYRFTYTQPAAGKKGPPAKSRILIEGLGTATAPKGAQKPVVKEGSKAPPDPVADKLKAASISISGYSKSERRALREAIGQVPASHLALLKGLTFRRGSVWVDENGKARSDVGGHYERESNTITMFDAAFKKTQVVFDEKGVATSFAAKQIVHEIGHAVDVAPLRAAEAAVDAARRDLNAKASPKFSSKAEADAYKAAQKKYAKAQKDLDHARARSGTRVVTTTKKNAEGVPVSSSRDVIGKSPKGVKFRAAVRADGKDVSKYGEEDWQESFAEAYSLYLTQPGLLKTIRPATYKYLDQTLPK